MRLRPHISFGGQCEAAFRFYERCLEGKIDTMLTWGNSPMANEVPAAWHAKICHASLLFGEQELAGADDFSESYQGIRGFQVLLDLDQPAEAERIFQALAEDGIVKIPLQKTFWAAHYGMLIDQFGVPWEINCSVD